MNRVGLIVSSSKLAFDAVQRPNRKQEIPSFSHSNLEEPNQVASVRQLGGWLSGFEVLMRHAELWREKLRGKLEYVQLHKLSRRIIDEDHYAQR
jgi:hypothetical protein